jgi:uncharacterized protein with NAD-binding domain and iron-sulfur cluster
MKGKRVLIVGGGVSGLSVAHELVERGFQVTLHERRARRCGHEEHEADCYGGKARSYEVAEPKDQSAGGAKDREARALKGGPRQLSREHHRSRAAAKKDVAFTNSPGEHGFRFFPAFYRHLPDLMSRIPSAETPKRSVADHLRAPKGLDQFATIRSRELIPFVSNFPAGKDIRALDRLRDGTRKLGLDPADVFFYFNRLWRVLTSCQERRFKDLENRGWYDFIEADKRSPSYRDYLGVGSTRNLVASRAETANARIIAEISIQTWMPILFPRPWNFADVGDRILDGPTQDVWIEPWVAYLRKRGVRILSNSELFSITVGDGKITELAFKPSDRSPADEERFRAATPAERRKMAAAERETRKSGWSVRAKDFDYVVLALPVEQVSRLITPEMAHLDESLHKLKSLTDHLQWMSGIQYYLPSVPARYEALAGHVNFVDSPWAVTAILQSMSWQRQFTEPLKAKGVAAVLSVCVSDWKRPGLRGQRAEECTPDEVATEVWRQIVDSLPDLASVTPGVPPYALDEDLGEQADTSSGLNFDLLQNAEPLLVNEKGSWAMRPPAGTRIRNLILAGDYVRTNTGLACMEGANESARAAVNEVIYRSGSNEEPCEIWELPEPLFAKAAQARDRARFDRGQPWRDLPGSPMSLLVEGGSRIAEFIENLRDRPES